MCRLVACVLAAVDRPVPAGSPEWAPRRASPPTRPRSHLVSPLLSLTAALGAVYSLSHSAGLSNSTSAVTKQLSAAATTMRSQPPQVPHTAPPHLYRPPAPRPMASFVCLGSFKTLCYTLNHTGPLTGTCYCTCVLHCTLHPAPCVFLLHLYLAPV